MRVLIAVLAALAALPALAADAPFPAGYWERGYGFGEAAAQINVSLRVKDLARAEVEVDRLLTKSGATMRSLNQGYGGYNGGQQPRQKSLAFFVPMEKSDAAAKSILDAGELQNFSSSRSSDGNQAEELRRKVQQLEEETAKNAESLKKMPIASYFLNFNLTRLRQSRDAMEAAASKALLNVTLIELQEKKK